jgi:flagellar hook-basal body complex protein FliE
MDAVRIDSLQKTPGINRETQGQEGGPDFKEAMKGAINNVNNLEKSADRSVMDLLEGKAEINETMVALQKADISMRLLLTFRNKVIEAYKEIIRMPF